MDNKQPHPDCALCSCSLKLRLTLNFQMSLSSPVFCTRRTVLTHSNTDVTVVTVLSFSGIV